MEWNKIGHRYKICNTHSHTRTPSYSFTPTRYALRLIFNFYSPICIVCRVSVFNFSGHFWNRSACRYGNMVCVEREYVEIRSLCVASFFILFDFVTIARRPYYIYTTFITMKSVIKIGWRCMCGGFVRLMFTHCALHILFPIFYFIRVVAFCV